VVGNTDAQGLQRLRIWEAKLCVEIPQSASSVTAACVHLTTLKPTYVLMLCGKRGGSDQSPHESCHDISVSQDRRTFYWLCETVIRGKCAHYHGLLVPIGSQMTWTCVSCRHLIISFARYAGSLSFGSVEKTQKSLQGAEMRATT
jgi:hypothetical protein